MKLFLLKDLKSKFHVITAEHNTSIIIIIIIINTYSTCHD